jgi:hypothetical protein
MYNNLAQALAKVLNETATLQINKHTDINQYIQTELPTFIASILNEYIKEINNIHNVNISVQISNEDVQVIADAYIKFIDKGVSGTEVRIPDSPFGFNNKQPPVNAIKDWIREKNINVDDIDSAAYAIANSIFRKGIAKKNIYSKDLPMIIESITDYVADFTAECIATSLVSK